MPNAKTAAPYRMILPGETCPFGVRGKPLLEDNGYRRFLASGLHSSAS